jgi:hypothetical protein
MLEHAGRKRKRIRSHPERTSADYADHTDHPGSDKSKLRDQKPECRSAETEKETARAAKNAKGDVTPTGAKRGEGISQASADDADVVTARNAKRKWSKGC